MNNKKSSLSFFCFVVIYNVLYGGLCFYFAGLAGVLFGASIMALACITGMLLKTDKNE